MSMHGTAVLPGANSAELQVNPGEKGKVTLAMSWKQRVQGRKHACVNEVSVLR